jgi:hypothetical protein
MKTLKRNSERMIINSALDSVEPFSIKKFDYKQGG